MPDINLRDLYRVAVGHNVAFVSLNIVVPQPREGFVRPTQRDYTDTTYWEQSLYSPPEWNITTRLRYQALLTQFGILTAKTADITWYAPDQTFTWKIYNGRAIQPEMGEDVNHQRFFTRNTTIYIVDLEELI